MYLDIIRWTYNEHGIFGVIRYNDRLLGYSLELPFKNNKPFISSIPLGIYPAEVVPFRGYKAILLKDVPGRTDILIHIGNWTHEIEGCILPGSQTKVEKDKTKMVLNSRVTLEKLIRVVKDDPVLKVRVILV